MQDAVHSVYELHRTTLHTRGESYAHTAQDYSDALHTASPAAFLAIHDGRTPTSKLTDDISLTKLPDNFPHLTPELIGLTHKWQHLNQYTLRREIYIQQYTQQPPYKHLYSLNNNTTGKLTKTAMWKKYGTVCHDLHPEKTNMGLYTARRHSRWSCPHAGRHSSNHNAAPTTHTPIRRQHERKCCQK